MTYVEKLKNPKWQKKRLEILQRDEFKCCYCNDDETELQIHHLKYTKEPWDASNEDLICLCKHCHKIVSFRKNLEVIFVDKYEQDDNVIFLNIKHKLNNDICITTYNIIDDIVDEIITFKVNGKFHKSLLKLTS